jgi:serine/threonine protein kinase
MEAGPRIGSYVVREVLGQGGMGTVYLAEHAVIGKKVAIKVLKRDLAGHDNLVARFINEARANAVVGHPGIVDVYDVGTLPSGVPYLVMEYLQGESLAQRIARLGQVPVREAATIVWETASAVGAAHAKGIVHRDLKPENLFLARDPATPEVERVKVLDFGIAKLHANPSKISTQTGAVMGTPVYMSPEQCRGAREEVDERTDIYSLGVIFYEMLCGKPPFQGEAFGDLLLRHMTEAPAPPSAQNHEVSEAM